MKIFIYTDFTEDFKKRKKEHDMLEDHLKKVYPDAEFTGNYEMCGNLRDMSEQTVKKAFEADLIVYLELHKLCFIRRLAALAETSYIPVLSISTETMSEPWKLQNMALAPWWGGNSCSQ